MQAESSCSQTIGGKPSTEGSKKHKGASEQEPLGVRVTGSVDLQEHFHMARCEQGTTEGEFGPPGLTSPPVRSSLDPPIFTQSLLVQILVLPPAAATPLPLFPKPASGHLPVCLPFQPTQPPLSAPADPSFPVQILATSLPSPVTSHHPKVQGQTHHLGPSTVPSEQSPNCSKAQVAIRGLDPLHSDSFLLIWPQWTRYGLTLNTRQASYHHRTPNMQFPGPPLLFLPCTPGSPPCLTLAP